MEKQIEANLIKLFEEWSGEKASDIVKLPQSGSYRTYYRIFNGYKTAIGVHNADQKENIAFLSFTKHFLKNQLPVPDVLAEQMDQDIYLLQDLGDTTLYAYLTAIRKQSDFPRDLKDIYKHILEDLPRFQIKAAQGLDYSVCYPRASFDKQSMMWDLNYFKYYFLKLARIPFDEQYLEDDFQQFSDFLLQAESNYFLYRDFQSRNIMILQGKPFYIDYQGGRKGALQYDLASLLYDAKADIPHPVKDELLDHYITNLNTIQPVDRQRFMQFFQGFVFVRIMQAMGAYGFRGFYEKKTHFLQSIPYAIKNLQHLLENYQLPLEIPALRNVWEALVSAPELKQFNQSSQVVKRLKVSINSFSFKKGIPEDQNGNGGGFVFDCRAIHNPGRYEKYKQMTGKDAEVIDFLQKESEIDDFLKNVYALVDSSVETYLSRKFTDLMVNFGCTGGQHRSVYCAENLARHLKNKYDLIVELHHREMEKLNVLS
ncbi:MAG: RapZ C-terminal domain-containing protein [Candidatus Cyclobacteriaceae bacterium M3_2C_046]